MTDLLEQWAGQPCNYCSDCNLALSALTCQGVGVADEPGRRERKKTERRRCIERTAIDLFEAHGFEATTIDDIAAAADIAPRTFFSYFPTKEDVVLADHAGRLDRIVAELARRPHDEGPWAALLASFLVVAADYETERDDLIRRFTITAMNPTVHARSLALQAGWENTLTEVVADRVGASEGDITPRLLAAASLACMRSSLHQWFATAHQTPLPDLVQGCFEQLADGLAPLA
jgi:AcrR family transcriptional regulator